MTECKGCEDRTLLEREAFRLKTERDSLFSQKRQFVKDLKEIKNSSRDSCDNPMCSWGNRINDLIEKCGDKQ